MDEIPEILEALSRAILGLGVDPSALLTLHKSLSLPTAGGLAGLGLLVCLFGSRRATFRVVLIVPAIAVGFFLLGPRISALLHLSKGVGAYAAAGTLGVLTLVSPPAVLGLGAGALGGLLGSEFVEAADFWLGFIPGFLLAGALAVLGTRFLAIVVSGLLGAIGLSLGGAALLATTPFASLVNRSPAALLAAFTFIAIGSMAAQLKLTPTEDELAKLRADKKRTKQLKVEAKERDKRLRSYSKTRK